MPSWKYWRIWMEMQVDTAAIDACFGAQVRNENLMRNGERQTPGASRVRSTEPGK
jgi:hypothetical protein